MCGSVGTDASSATCYARERAHAGRVAPHLVLPPAISGAGKGVSGEEAIKSRKGPGAPRPWSRVPIQLTLRLYYFIKKSTADRARSSFTFLPSPLFRNLPPQDAGNVCGVRIHGRCPSKYGLKSKMCYLCSVRSSNPNLAGLTMIRQKAN